MARKPKVIIDGQEELYRRLQAVSKVVRRQVGAMNREAALKGLDLARQLVPVVTGELLESLDYRGAGTAWSYGTYGYEGGRPVPRWVEFGTVRSAAHPFLRPAAEAARAYVQRQTGVVAHDLPFQVSRE